MNAILLGPWLVPLSHLYLAITALMVLLAMHALLPLPASERLRWATGMMVAWLVGARLGAVVDDPTPWLTTPTRLFDPGQPGFSLVGGLIGAGVWSCWQLHARPRRIALLLLVLAQPIWLGMNYWRPFAAPAALTQLPTLTLSTPQGGQFTLDNTPTRQPTLLVLWRSDCARCHETLSQLSRWASTVPARIVAVNEGESLLQTARWLDARSLSLPTVLLDPRQLLMARSRAPALPAILLFDARGRLLDQQAGQPTFRQWHNWQNRLSARASAVTTPIQGRTQERAQGFAPDLLSQQTLLGKIPRQTNPVWDEQSDVHSEAS